MNWNKQHPEKAQMIKAIEKNENPFEAHFKNCETCYHQFLLLKKMVISMNEPMDSLRKDAIERFKNIPLLGKEQFAQNIIVGALTQDSWRNTANLDIRDVTVGYVRRLKMTAGKISVELIAERQEKGWSFVARVYTGKSVSTAYVMKIGLKKILANASGFYQWSSDNTPRKLTLQAINKNIEFNNISWS